MVTYMNENDILSRLPLREPTFFILLSLSPGPKHGYAILKEVEALSDGRVRLSTGTLYGAIKRLLDDDWIRRVDDPLPNRTNAPCWDRRYIPPQYVRIFHPEYAIYDPGYSSML